MKYFAPRVLALPKAKINFCVIMKTKTGLEHQLYIVKKYV